jgi:hypothetical protein
LDIFGRIETGIRNGPTRYAVSWNLLTFQILTLGALTSILTAIGNVDQRILIGLPALSSLCGRLADTVPAEGIVQNQGSWQDRGGTSDLQAQAIQDE